jgi:hypothetical protein
MTEVPVVVAVAGAVGTSGTVPATTTACVNTTAGHQITSERWSLECRSAILISSSYSRSGSRTFRSVRRTRPGSCRWNSLRTSTSRHRDIGCGHEVHRDYSFYLTSCELTTTVGDRLTTVRLPAVGTGAHACAPIDDHITHRPTSRTRACHSSCGLPEHTICTDTCSGASLVTPR